jgi:hypothetical protein
LPPPPIEQLLPKEREREALGYVEQAAEFYEGAENPQIRSRPLLYYLLIPQRDKGAADCSRRTASATDQARHLGPKCQRAGSVAF